MKEHQTLSPETKKFRLAVHWPQPEIPFSLGRCVGPFTAMMKEDPRFEIHIVPRDERDVDWHWLAQCDALFILNPITDFHANLITTAKLMGLPVWSDFGDDVFTVHPDNPNYKAFANKKGLREVIEPIVRASDVCTVPTDTARKSFPLAERILLIGEACRWRPQFSPRRKLVSWRGMSSHQEDLRSVLPALLNVFGDPLFDDWGILFYGDPDWKVLGELSRVIGEPWDTDEKYANKRLLISPHWPTPFHQMASWAQHAPYLHIVPLADNAFARSKPPNAWMEATAAGAAVIGPDFPEWKNHCPGLITYEQGMIERRDKEDFETVLRREMATFTRDRTLPSRPTDTVLGVPHPNVKTSQDAIWPGHTLATVNQRRWAVIRKLAELANPQIKQAHEVAA